MNPSYHKIPLKVLFASCICVPKMDGRHYLTYIKVQKGYVTSTDGYQLFICHVDELDKELIEEIYNYRSRNKVSLKY